MPRGSALACVILACELASVQLAAAQAVQPNPPPAAVPAPAADAPAKRAVLLVMESAGGVRAAAALRTALNNQRELKVMSLAEVTQKRLQPAAIVTVAAIGAQTVSVAYWDTAGGRDTLSAPAPARADQLDAVVFALASALLDRHRDDWNVALGVRPSDELYAVLSRVGRLTPRTNVALRFEDF